LKGKRTNLYEYLAAAQRTTYSVLPMHTTQEFQLFSTSIVNGSHLLRILILKLWLPGGQERLMARQFSIKSMSIFKIITRNRLEKRGKMKI
jgi:hypothetical protein